MAIWNKILRRLNDNNTDQYEVVMTADRYGNIYDPADTTSKNRVKISDSETLFFNTFQYGIETDVWDTGITGTASATHDLNLSHVDLSVGGALGDKIVRQTRHVQRYVPGRSSTLSFAINMNAPVEGVRKRFGLFTESTVDNLLDGCWFEDTGAWIDNVPQYACVVSNGAGGYISIPRSEWNGDKLDGTGISGILADPEKLQLISIDYEWYGAGQVKFGWVIDGRTRVVHTHSTANISVEPWASTPFLPIRMEMEVIATPTVTGPFIMIQGSNSLIAENSQGHTGTSQNVTSSILGTRNSGANEWNPVLSIRLNANDLGAVVLPKFLQAVTLDNTNLFYRLVRNPTLPPTVALGADGPQPWKSVDPVNGFAEYQTYISPIEVLDADQGTSVESGFVIGGGGGGAIPLDPAVAYQLGRTQLGAVSDTLTVLCAMTNTAKDSVVSMTWIEQR